MQIVPGQVKGTSDHSYLSLVLRIVDDVPGRVVDSEWTMHLQMTQGCRKSGLFV